MSLPASDLTKKADNLTTMQLGRVLPETAEVRNGHLYIGGVDMVELAHNEGTALYVYDEDDLRHRAQTFVNAFHSHYENSDVIYASKAFLNKAMARLASEEGLCLDVSGGGELACALSAGFSPEKVFVHGNNKTLPELKEAISAGVGRIVVDSITELENVSKISKELGRTQDIYLRITPGIEADTHEYIRTGCEDSKFGFTTRDDFAYECIGKALATENVCLKGLHCHIGSQIFALHSFAEAAGVMVELMSRVRDDYNVVLPELDLGGGLGIAYTATDEPSTIDEFAATVCSSVKEQCEKYDIPLPRLLVEPGRSMVATAGVALYTVGSIKTLPGIRKYIAIDGGMSDNIRTALYHASYEAVLANKADQPRTEIVTLCGKHCESGDAVVIDMPLQVAEVGDVACVFGTGAYCISMSSNYNGQPRPAIVFVRNGNAKVVTRRETYEDMMRRDM